MNQYTSCYVNSELYNIVELFQEVAYKKIMQACSVPLRFSYVLLLV